MSLSKWLKTTTNTLSNVGITAVRGFPAAKIQVPESPVAVVMVERSDIKETMLAIQIYCDAALGGAVCEDTAQEAAEALRQMGGICQVEACQYDSRNNLLSAKILTLWKESITSSVKVNGKTLYYATAFSAVQNRQIQHVTDEESGVTGIETTERIWTIAVQEQLPLYETPEVESEGPFTVKVTHRNYVETFPNCYWMSITLEESGDCLLRKRIARSWSERIIN